MLRITEHIVLQDHEIVETFVRSPGPGGQNVNKVATAVELRFDAASCPCLTGEIRDRLFRLAGKRAGRDGSIRIQAHRFRTRERNRQDALERLAALIRAAATLPKTRRPTRPGLAAKQRRLAAKRCRARLKRSRGTPAAEE